MWRFALLALLLAGCQSPTPGMECADPTGAGLNGSISTTDFGGSSCGEFDAGTKPGDPCEGGSDCTPVCCACPGDAGGASASVGYCLGSSKDHLGTCATSELTCCTFSHLEGTTEAGTCM